MAMCCSSDEQYGVFGDQGELHHESKIHHRQFLCQQGQANDEL